MKNINYPVTIIRAQKNNDPENPEHVKELMDIFDDNDEVNVIFDNNPDNSPGFIIASLPYEKIDRLVRMFKEDGTYIDSYLVSDKPLDEDVKGVINFEAHPKLSKLIVESIDPDTILDKILEKGIDSLDDIDKIIIKNI